MAGQAPRTTMRGHLEGLCSGVAWGWAISRAEPQHPATIELLLDGEPVATALADHLRPDHAGASASGHRCGFVIDLRAALASHRSGRLTLRDAATGVPFGGDGLAYDVDGGGGAVDGCEGIDVTGWVAPHGPDRTTVEIEVLVDGQPVATTVADQPRPDLRRAGALLLRTGFRCALPVRFHDGQPHAVTARVRATGQPLAGDPAVFVAQVRAHVDRLDPDRVSGWIANLPAPTEAVRFDLWIDGRCVRRKVVPWLRREDVEQALLPAGSGPCPMGFELPLQPPLSWRREGHTVELRRPGGDDLLAEPVRQVRPDATIALLEDAARQLLCGPADATARAARDMLAETIHGMRRRQTQPWLVPAPEPVSAEAPVDVIVPVYKGREETLACLDSVLAAAGDGPAMELVVIHDAGPDLPLAQELRRRAAEGRFTLLENERNRGFVATVNRGMRLHPERDVVLLNSDTEVPRGWLRRLRDAAYAGPGIATVTPLSNRATIFSLPRTCIDNDLPEGLDLHAMDALLAEANPGVRAEVPTAMGFCMYIRREALADVGPFDEERWAQGYAEENDFSLRALARGWRHLAACDVFVLHHGSVSFGDEKPQRVRENLEKLNAIYPDYPARIERFLETDPIAPARARVNVRLLQRLAPSWVLFVSHGMGGGTDTAMDDLRRVHEAAGRRVLLLRSTPAGGLELLPLGDTQEKTLVTELPGDTPPAALAGWLRELGVTEIHLHHEHGFRFDVFELPAALDVPFDVTLHDYYTACPRVTMIDAGGRWCAEAPVAVCDHCVASGPALERPVRLALEAAGGRVAGWRSSRVERLRRARRVSAPSRDAAERLQRLLGLPVAVEPHPEAPFDAPAGRRGDPRRIAVIGGIGPHKGVDLLHETAALALATEAPLHFVVVGHTSRDADFALLPNVEITGRYEPADLPRLLSATGCGTALFLSIWPETYGYTLSEAWRAGLDAVALDLGAQAERIRAHGRGRLVPYPATARDVLAALNGPLA